jgi:5-methylcytosine-specific restriction endonuclease McrA
MPTYPHNTQCSELGCHELRSRLNSFCLKHGGKDNMAMRETDSIYQTPAWKTLRRRQLSIQPLCQACLSRGKIEVAEHVDHLFAWKHVGKHAFLRNIFQSLCHADHSHKTGMEKQGRYIHYTADGEKEYTINDYAYVVMHEAHTNGA